MTYKHTLHTFTFSTETTTPCSACVCDYLLTVFSSHVNRNTSLPILCPCGQQRMSRKTVHKDITIITCSKLAEAFDPSNQIKCHHTSNFAMATASVFALFDFRTCITSLILLGQVKIS